MRAKRHQFTVYNEDRIPEIIPMRPSTLKTVLADCADSKSRASVNCLSTGSLAMSTCRQPGGGGG